MAEQVIACPKCSTRIPLSEAYAQQFRDSMQKEIDAKIADERRRQQDELARALQAERQRLDEKRAVELRDLQLQIQEKDKKLLETREAELALRRRERELEDRARSIELEAQRKLDAERKRIEEETRQRADLDHRQKQLEADKTIADMKKTIDDLKRKADQGSQQTQGEVVELELEGLLKSLFPLDQIEPVAKGVRGADVVQRVIDKNGQLCGTLIWESKQTKVWSDGWIQKLKDDQRDMKADVAVLLTAALPRGTTTFCCMNDVWVTSHACLSGLAVALRTGIEQLAFARNSAVGKKEKMEALYRYLMGNEFNQRVQAVVETTRTLGDELEREKRAYQRIWAERRKQIDRIETSMIGMYGDLKGLGAALPQIDALELDSELVVAAPARATLPRPDRAAEENEDLF